MIYFTADIHWKHNARFLLDDRGFESGEEHDTAILKAINSTVKRSDVLWILGDVVWKEAPEFLHSLKCDYIRIVRGNHDGKLYNDKRLLNRKKIVLRSQLEDVKYDGQKITLCHYPMVSWNASHYDSWLLYGHVHGKTLPMVGKMFDVCPKADHLAPYSLDEVKEIMSTLPHNWDYVDKSSH